MNIEFYKYHGTGNDFVLIDNREGILTDLSSEKIKNICNRHFGIGADGLILLEGHEELDFKMVYFNSDGRQSSMCGNGGRCIVAFAHKLGIIGKNTKFLAIDGLHEAEILNDKRVKLKMKDVENINVEDLGLRLDTGSPHLLVQSTLNNLDVNSAGGEIRYSEPYSKDGINVNFVSYGNGSLKMRTYERGVEAETLSCGTGVTAAAIGMHYSGKTELKEIFVETEGGNLSVSFDVQDGKYTDIWLTGPASFVFKGELKW